MIKIFVFEFITGGGLLSLPDAPVPEGSLLQEGAGMFLSISKDFLADPRFELVTLRDHRIEQTELFEATVREVRSAEEEQALFLQNCNEADYTLIIAPEFENCLTDRVRWAEENSATLLSPGLEFVQLCSDKWKLAELWLVAGVKTPPTFLTTEKNRLAIQGPIVVKPRYGAGSEDISIYPTPDARDLSDELVIQPQISGMSVSISALGNSESSQAHFFPPSQQLVSAQQNYAYRGSKWPLDEQLQRRALKLAKEALGPLPNFDGYVGIDLILGHDDTGKDDVVVEVNPRLTTSYLGLRQLCQQNIAAAMVDLVQGKRVEL
ncbi:MAG: hypothetical protein COA78_35835, partial [Blastopirellula sp.]